MKTWKKNTMAAAILVTVCAGIYVNWTYTENASMTSLSDTLDADKILGSSTLVLGTDAALDAAGEDLEETVADYFAAVRLSRQEARDDALALLQEVMSYGESKDSDEASAQLDALVNTALCEAQIESLVIAKGYTDCVAYMTDSGISVAVASPEEGLKQADIAVICDIILSQSDVSMEDIRVVEVK
jgi:stage III sporulation protein AH